MNSDDEWRKLYFDKDNELGRFRHALELLYDKWENGDAIHELDDGEPTGAYMGNCVQLSWEEENDILLLIGSEGTKTRIRRQPATKQAM